MTQTLKPKAIAQAALEFHAAGKLVAQHPEIILGYQRAGDCRCAIGAGLNDETLHRLTHAGKHYTRVDALVGIVQTDTLPEMVQLRQLQDLHDSWHTDRHAETAFLDYARELAQ